MRLILFLFIRGKSLFKEQSQKKNKRKVSNYFKYYQEQHAILYSIHSFRAYVDVSSVDSIMKFQCALRLIKRTYDLVNK